MVIDVALEITEADCGAFARDGFLIRDRIISSEAVELLRAAMTRSFEGDYDTGLMPDEVNWRPGQDPHVTRQICNVWKANRTLASVILSPAIGRAVANLNGWPGARLAQDNLLWKPPMHAGVAGGSLGMHQDSAYALWAKPELMCTVWIALDDVSAAGGTLEFARGSHLWDRSGPIRQFHNPEDYQQDFRRAAFAAAVSSTKARTSVLLIGDAPFESAVRDAADTLDIFPSHRDDAAIWLFSGGTTGRPKAVVQTHRSFANTTERYAKQVIGYSERDVTLSVPKLFFGYATGSNLLFPFAVGGTSVLYPERCTAEVIFAHIARHRPTILVNVPTMINHMVNHPEASRQDLSSLRLATSAGEALPAELHRRWRDTFGVELLDGLGTAEMWHIFISNQPGKVKPGTLGTVVPGFEVKACDENGHPVDDGEVGWLWVRGQSRAIGYWQHMEQTAAAFRGEWYVSGDMVRRDADGYFTYAGRGDDMLKVRGKWLSPQEVENCLLQHPTVREAAVVGVAGEDGLTHPYAFVVASGEESAAPAEDLKAFVKTKLASYKEPREIVFMDTLPRTHLGKVDRARLRGLAP